MRNANVRDKNGFTILEVMVALAIIGISIGIFFGLIGNSSRLREKIDGHARSLLVARARTEETFLGILDKKHITTLNEKKTFDGTTKDGVQWKVSEIDKYKEAEKKISEGATDADTTDIDESKNSLPPKGTTMLSTLVEGINIDTIFFSEESGTDESEEDEEEEGEVVSE